MLIEKTGEWLLHSALRAGQETILNFLKNFCQISLGGGDNITQDPKMSEAVPPSAPPPPPPAGQPLPVAGTQTVHMDFEHLRYSREAHFYSKFAPELEKLRKNDAKLEQKIENQEERFVSFLSHSVQIDQLGSLPQVIQTVKQNLKTDTPINIFLFDFPEANAMATAQLAFDGKSSEELFVLVGHHYLNHLTDQERVVILGHELGHLMLGHTSIPAMMLLDPDVDLSKTPEVRADVLRWAICKEISCDVFGFVASGGDTSSCSSALIKYHTSLTEETYNAMGGDALIQQVLSQYDSLSDSVVESVISTHPLMPLRLRLFKLMGQNPYLSHYGQEVSADNFKQMQEEFHDAAEPVIREIYPELFEEQTIDQGFILFYLGVAIALADGQIDREEVDAIQKMVSPEIDSAAFFQSLEDTLQKRDHTSVGQELVDRAVEEAKQKSYGKNEATQFVRKLLVVAAADGKVDSSELLMIFHFASNFGFSKQEIVYLANQVTVKN